LERIYVSTVWGTSVPNYNATEDTSPEEAIASVNEKAKRLLQEGYTEETKRLCTHGNATRPQIHKKKTKHGTSASGPNHWDNESALKFSNKIIQGP